MLCKKKQAGEHQAEVPKAGGKLLLDEAEGANEKKTSRI